VGLVMDQNRFKNYTQDMYNEDYATLKNDVDGVRTNMINVFDVPDVNDMWNMISVKNITFENIQ